jgi:hypothetical protein
MKIRPVSSLLPFLLAFFAFAFPAKAEDYSRIRIVRLSLVQGDVQFQRPGEDWQDAKLNLPIEEGFALRTTEGYAEVEFEDSLVLRLGTNATVQFSQLGLRDGGRLTTLNLSQGTALVTANLKRADAVSVITPALSAVVPHDSRFRIDINSNETWVSVFHGKVEIDSHGGATSLLSGGHTVKVDANGSRGFEAVANPPQDDFDKWAAHRDDASNASARETSSAITMNSYTAGFSDLYDYGVWTSVPGYGFGWMPYGLGAGWMPFVNGQWQFLGGLGWNWVSAEPWGWLPYHFGSWVNAPGIGWAWLPVGATTWTPATARWVQVNNQFGWVPSGPPLSEKPTKAQLAATPSTAVLAASASGGAISAGARMPLESSSRTETVAAPTANFALAGNGRLTSSTAVSPSNARIFVQSAAAPARPVAIPAPSAPRALMAPHTPAAPAIARGASAAGLGPRSGSGSAMGARSGSSMSAPAHSSSSSSASTSGHH